MTSLFRQTPIRPPCRAHPVLQSQNRSKASGRRHSVCARGCLLHRIWRRCFFTAADWRRRPGQRLRVRVYGLHRVGGYARRPAYELRTKPAERRCRRGEDKSFWDKAALGCQARGIRKFVYPSSRGNGARFHLHWRHYIVIRFAWLDSGHSRFVSNERSHISQRRLRHGPNVHHVDRLRVFCLEVCSDHRCPIEEQFCRVAVSIGIRRGFSARVVYRLRTPTSSQTESRADCRPWP